MGRNGIRWYHLRMHKQLTSGLIGITLLSVALAILAACAPIAAPTPTKVTDTPTSTPTLTLTPTFDWFPATTTPTREPTPEPSPTPDLRPGIGEVIYQDDFSEDVLWSSLTPNGGRVTITNNHITLTLNDTIGSVFGIRKSPQLTDYYAEVTASPNYCQGENEYGLIIRVYGEQLNHYRFSLSCDGRARVTRIVDGRALIIKDWEGFMQLPTTYPNNFRMGVWVKGTEVRFFFNDMQLFAVDNAVIVGGSLGVFARSSEADAISVNFSDLTVYQLTGTEE